MFSLKHHSAPFASPNAVGLRVANVRQAAEFYQRIGFTFVMAVPDEHDEWLLCLLHYGSGSILLGPLDHRQFPRTHRPQRIGARARGLGVRIDLTVTDLGATYGACTTEGCQITDAPRQELWGDCTFSCLDPFGYEWRFTEKAERAMFGHRSREAEVLSS
jgi:uncharacterized glyoxalase superfamily protein PhnB